MCSWMAGDLIIPFLLSIPAFCPQSPKISDPCRLKLKLEWRLHNVSISNACAPKILGLQEPTVGLRGIPSESDASGVSAQRSARTRVVVM